MSCTSVFNKLLIFAWWNCVIISWLQQNLFHGGSRGNWVKNTKQATECSTGIFNAIRWMEMFSWYDLYRWWDLVVLFHPGKQLLITQVASYLITQETTQIQTDSVNSHCENLLGFLDFLPKDTIINSSQYCETLASRSKARGFKPGWGQWIFSGSNPEHKSSGRRTFQAR